MKAESFSSAQKQDFTHTKKPSSLSELDLEFAAFQSEESIDANIGQKYENDRNIEKEILTSTIKSLKNSGEKFNIEDVSALSLNKINLDKFMIAEFMLAKRRDSLSPEDVLEYETIINDKKQMENIYRENYNENILLQSELIEDFNQFLKGDSRYYQNKKILAYGSEMYVLKYKDQVVSFNRFDMMHGNKLYFKSFNVNKSVQGSGLGQMMCRGTLDAKAQDHTIVADCTSSKPISAFYIENGFIARKFAVDHGERHLSIIRDDKTIPNEFKTKTISREDILSEKNLPIGSIVKRSETQKGCDFSYIITEKQEQSEDKIPYHNAKEKYVLTRYFFDKQSQEWVTVFEPVKRELSDFL